MQVTDVSAAGVELAKFSALRDALRERLDRGLLVAFSGGVDSAFLLWAAEQQRKASGGRLLALTTNSASFSAAEADDVRAFIRLHDIPHVWRESRELENPRYTANDRSRCYYCKSELFRICREEADSSGLEHIAYGYNASDGTDDRPGHRSAVENGILSPLADARLTKNDIRSLMQHFGLEMADKPASPCLSSRIMTGVPITPRKLRDVEELEATLREGGLRVFRVRVHESGETKLLRLEVAPDEMQRAFELREMFCTAAKQRGYRWATLDLAGYEMGGGNAAK